jgi:hypothetical protein
MYKGDSVVIFIRGTETIQDWMTGEAVCCLLVVNPYALCGADLLASRLSALTGMHVVAAERWQPRQTRT